MHFATLSLSLQAKKLSEREIPDLKLNLSAVNADIEKLNATISEVSFDIVIVCSMCKVWFRYDAGKTAAVVL